MTAFASAQPWARKDARVIEIRPDAAGDVAAPLQSAIDAWRPAAADRFAPAPTLLLPGGSFTVARPVFLDASNVTIAGRGRRATRLTAKEDNSLFMCGIHRFPSAGRLTRAHWVGLATLRLKDGATPAIDPDYAAGRYGLRTYDGSLSVQGSATGGTVAVSYRDPHNGDAEHTNTFAYNCTASDVQSWLESIVGAGNVACGGGPLDAAPITYEFRGAYADAQAPRASVPGRGRFEVAANGLTGAAPAENPELSGPIAVIGQEGGLSFPGASASVPQPSGPTGAAGWDHVRQLTIDLGIWGPDLAHAGFLSGGNQRLNLVAVHEAGAEVSSAMAPLELVIADGYLSLLLRLDGGVNVQCSAPAPALAENTLEVSAQVDLDAGAAKLWVDNKEAPASVFGMVPGAKFAPIKHSLMMVGRAGDQAVVDGVGGSWGDVTLYGLSVAWSARWASDAGGGQVRASDGAAATQAMKFAAYGSTIHLPLDEVGYDRPDAGVLVPCNGSSGWGREHGVFLAAIGAEHIVSGASFRDLSLSCHDHGAAIWILSSMGTEIDRIDAGGGAHAIYKVECSGSFGYPTGIRACSASAGKVSALALSTTIGEIQCDISYPSQEFGNYGMALYTFSGKVGHCFYNGLSAEPGSAAFRIDASSVVLEKICIDAEGWHGQSRVLESHPGAIPTDVVFRECSFGQTYAEVPPYFNLVGMGAAYPCRLTLERCDGASDAAGPTIAAGDGWTVRVADHRDPPAHWFSGAGDCLETRLAAALPATGVYGAGQHLIYVAGDGEYACLSGGDFAGTPPVFGRTRPTDAAGRLIVATAAADPTDAPTDCAMVFNTANNKLWIYNGGWKSVQLA